MIGNNQSMDLDFENESNKKSNQVSKHQEGNKLLTNKKN